jgi:hypothetical protein
MAASVRSIRSGTRAAEGLSMSTPSTNPPRPRPDPVRQTPSPEPPLPPAQDPRVIDAVELDADLLLELVEDDRVTLPSPGVVRP